LQATKSELGLNGSVGNMKVKLERAGVMSLKGVEAVNLEGALDI
jgi:hypothetical protein